MTRAVMNATILLTGVNGQVGFELARTPARFGQGRRARAQRVWTSPTWSRCGASCAK